MSEEYKIPFYFKRKNECVVCGGINSLRFIDKFGRIAKEELRSFSYIKCFNCGKSYNIKWEKDENSDKMYPSAVDFEIDLDFENLANYNIDNTNIY